MPALRLIRCVSLLCVTGVPFINTTLYFAAHCQRLIDGFGPRGLKDRIVIVHPSVKAQFFSA